MRVKLPNAVKLIVCLAIPVITIPCAYLLLPASVHYHVVETYNITAPEGPAIVKLGAILPKTGPYQTVKNTKITWNGEIDKVSFAYVDAYKLWGEIGSGQEGSAVIEYDIILPQGKVSWESPVELIHTMPQTGIESDHPSIIQKASDLSDDPYAIYRFTSNHIVFTDHYCEDTDASGLEAYLQGSGSCLSYSRLMVSLCRASGIPSLLVIGSVLPDNLPLLPYKIAQGMPGHGHAWVEYHSQGSWHMADPSWGTQYASVLEFNRNDGRHLSFGDYDHFVDLQQILSRWAVSQSFLMHADLTHIITSSKDSTSIATEISLIKKFDGRWVNTLLVFIVITYSLYKIRGRFINISNNEYNSRIKS